MCLINEREMILDLQTAEEMDLRGDKITGFHARVIIFVFIALQVSIPTP